MVEADKMAKASWKGSDDRKMESEISTHSKGRLNIRKTCDTMANSRRNARSWVLSNKY